MEVIELEIDDDYMLLSKLELKSDGEEEETDPNPDPNRVRVLLQQELF